ncbi:hypothetical protein ACFWQL_40115, partial [Amycolatopsis thermoflava]|uniref:hypothetical protein n=1 Tax=Amycolatopsis thermoflava TaxID=84480 RepID=UPI00365F896C
VGNQLLNHHISMPTLDQLRPADAPIILKRVVSGAVMSLAVASWFGLCPRLSVGLFFRWVRLREAVAGGARAVGASRWLSGAVMSLAVASWFGLCPRLSVGLFFRWFRLCQAVAGGARAV